jgi:hypothetical protein
MMSVAYRSLASLEQKQRSRAQLLTFLCNSLFMLERPTAVSRAIKINKRLDYLIER